MPTGRRQLLRGISVVTAGTLAGCSGSDSEPAGSSGDGGSSRNTDTETSGERGDTPSSRVTPTATVTGTQSSDSSGSSPPGKLTASDGDNVDDFGRSVAIRGDVLLVGAPNDEDPNGKDAGSAYVFRRDGDTWVEAAKLLPEDGDSEDSFGASVAISRDRSTLLVGAVNDEDPGGKRAGSVYAFTRESGSWTQQGKFAGSDVVNFDNFGNSLAVSSDGTTALVGIDNSAGGLGREDGPAYVFVRGDQSWTQQATLSTGERITDDRFGWAVALSDAGDTALVSAMFDDGPGGGSTAGSVYVFSRDAQSWTRETELVAGETSNDDQFGHAVAISGDGSTVLVGAINEDATDFAGAAYVFTESDGSWTERAALTPTEGDVEDYFGHSVALSADGTTALVGAPGEDRTDADTGSTYVFELADGNWTHETTLLAEDAQLGDVFGTSVAIDGSTAVAGAPFAEHPNGSTAGAAYLFDL